VYAYDAPSSKKDRDDFRRAEYRKVQSEAATSSPEFPRRCTASSLSRSVRIRLWPLDLWDGTSYIHHSTTADFYDGDRGVPSGILSSNKVVPAEITVLRWRSNQSVNRLDVATKAAQ